MMKAGLSLCTIK